MKILVTGSKGQLGCSIREKSIHYPDFSFLFTDVEELDICDSTAVDACFRDYMPDFVINCAAYTAVDKAEKEEVLAEKINHKAVLHLLKGCRATGARLIHISTDYLFDGTKPTPYHEKDIVRPASVYGITKLEGETAILRSDVKSVIIRTSWLYSEFGNNFVKTMLRLGKEKKEIAVVCDQTGTPTYAADLAGVILDIIARANDDPGRFVTGIYHYSNEGIASWYDFAQAVFEYLPGARCRAVPIDTSGYPTPARRPAYSVLNKSKIKSTFGIQIPYWRDSLKICLTKLQHDAEN